MLQSPSYGEILSQSESRESDLSTNDELFSVPPVSVRILRTGSGLVVGQPRTVECEVTGARPNHRVSWWKDGDRLTYSQTQTSPDGGTLVSSIVIVPEMTDSEATLQCKAETPGLEEIREHKWQLPVQCEYQTLTQTLSPVS